MNFKKEYHAKLMLAGEYGVIVGSEALTVPLSDFKARLSIERDCPDKEAIQSSHNTLCALHTFLSGLPESSFYSEPLLSDMEDALKKGMYVESNIPPHYGIGSSGAVSALIFDQFFAEKGKISDKELQEDLAKIESFFHGKSSGVDAMSSYKGVPLHFLMDGSIEKIEFDLLQLPGDYRFFLMDSKEILETEPLVKIFLEKMKQGDFKIEIMEDYLPLIQKFIAAITGKTNADPALIFRAMSDFQWKHFKEMIPESMEEAWITGQVSNAFYLKINGSGGGFLLGIAHQESKELVEELLAGKEIRWME